MGHYVMDRTRRFWYVGRGSGRTQPETDLSWGRRCEMAKRVGCSTYEFVRCGVAFAGRFAFDCVPAGFAFRVEARFDGQCAGAIAGYSEVRRRRRVVGSADVSCRRRS